MVWWSETTSWIGSTASLPTDTSFETWRPTSRCCPYATGFRAPTSTWVLDRFCRLICEFHRETFEATGQIRGCGFGNLATEMSTQDEKIRRKVDEIFRKYTGIFEEPLREAVERGDLPGIDPHDTAERIVVYIEGVNVIAKARNDLSLFERMGSDLRRLADSG